jgi:hypothetical protein
MSKTVDDQPDERQPIVVNIRFSQGEYDQPSLQRASTPSQLRTALCTCRCGSEVGAGAGAG